MNLKYQRHKGRREGKIIKKKDMQVGNIDLKERKHLSLTAPTQVSPKPLSHGPQGHYTDPAETQGGC